MANNAGKILKKWARRLLKILGLLIALLLLTWGLLQTQWGKNIAKNQAIKYLSKKLKTRISIDEITVEWFTHLRLNGVYIEDQQKRKLLSAQELDVKYDLSKILDNSLTINDLALKGVTIQLSRERKDSLFNFDFILAAFSGDESTPSTKPAAPFRLNMGTVFLSKININLDDQYGGQVFQLSLASLKTNIDTLDLEQVNIHAKYLFTDSLYCKANLFDPYVKKVKIEEKREGTPTPFSIALDSVHLAGTLFNFEDKAAHLKVNTSAGLLAGNGIAYSLDKMSAAIGNISLLDHTTAIIINSKFDTSVNTQPGKPDTSKPLTFFVKSLALDRNSFVFDDEAATTGPQRSMDFSHLAFKDIVLDAFNTGYDGKVYASEINQLKLNEKSGFRLNQLKTNAHYSDTGVTLKELVLNTTQNQLKGDVEIAYKSIDQITTKPGDTKINAVISDTRLQLDELLYFQPALSKNNSFRPLLGKKFYINTTVKGSLDKLTIPSISVKESQTSLLASAHIYNLPDVKKLLIDLRLQEFSGTRDELLSFLPPNTIADSLLHYIPQNFTLKGSYKGSMNDLQIDGQLNTSDGNIALNGSLKNITDKKNAVYDISATTSNLQAGKLLQDSLIGNISASVQLKGKGYDLPTANAAYDAKLEAAEYNGYTYHDINASGNINNNKLELHLQSNDPNIEVTTDTYYDMDKSKGSLRTETTIANADLLKLGFLEDTLVISGKLSADIPRLDSAQLDGHLLATALKLQYAGHQINIDSVDVLADYTNSLQTIQLNSPLLDFVLKGEYTIQALPAAAKTISNRYLYTYKVDTAYTKNMRADFQAKVHVPDSMLFFVPGLKSISPFSIGATLNTDSSSLTFATAINKIQYADYRIDSLAISGVNMPLKKEHQELVYDLTIRSITSPSLELSKTEVRGTILHGIINGKLNLLDENDKPSYSLPYRIVNDTLTPYLHINDSLLLDKKRWKVNSNNIIYLNTAALKGSNLQISNKSESISFFADSTNDNGLPLTLSLHQFKLKNMAASLNSDTSLVDGVAEGTVTVQSLAPFSFTSDLLIDSLRLKEVSAGDLSVKVSQQPGNILLAAVTLKGSDNDVSLNGTYNISDKNVALKLDMQQFNLQNIEPFTSVYLAKLKGKLKGGLTINGSLEKPEIRGSIKTDSVKAIYRDYATYISLPAEEITFEEDGINFKQFNLMDSAGNIATITGKLLTNNYQEFHPDLKIATKKFLVIDKKKYPNQAIYGPTWAAALINIRGNGKAIVIDGAVNIIDKSAFTYIYTASETTGSGEGLFEFFDPAHPIDTLVLAAKRKKSSDAMQIELNLNLAITAQSSVNIVLDELSGDQLMIKGTAALNFIMSPGGQMSLTGNYVAETGEYELSIANLMRKKFIIQKGSSISWSGDPLKAEMNITALYKVKTTAGELVKDIQSVPGIDKQKLNFEVYLFLKKELLKPSISFKLDMPVNEQEVFNDLVYNRIKQVNSNPAELNKQVMGLLVLNQFIADNPFSSAAEGAGNSLETKAYVTAGNILTNELMNLVGNSVKGLDINVALDVNEDYTTGTAQKTTDLKVGVTKSFAQNRLTVYVGSTFALEGENQNTSTAKVYSGDFTAEYMLTTDGKYRIKVFHLNEDDLSLLGTEVKTGVTFVLVLEFNKFKQNFKKNKNNTD